MSVPLLPMYVVETTSDYSDETLAAHLCDLYKRGYFIGQVIEPLQSDADTGYKIIAYLRRN